MDRPDENHGDAECDSDKPRSGTFVQNFASEAEPHLQGLLRLVPSVAVLVYAIGFIVFTSFLSGYGIYEVDFVSINFLVAGTLVIGLYIPVIIITLLTYRYYRTKPALANTPGLSSIVLSGLYGLLVAVVVLRIEATALVLLIAGGSLVSSLLGVALRRAMGWSIAILAGRWVMAICMVLAYSSAYVFEDEGKAMLMTTFMLTTLIVIWWKVGGVEDELSVSKILLFVIMAIGYLTFFGAYLYKNVPRELGGGMEVDKVLLVGPGNTNSLSRLGLTGSLIGQTEPLTIVYENSQRYYAQISDSLTIGIDKSLFIGEASGRLEMPVSPVDSTGAVDTTTAHEAITDSLDD